MNVIHDDPREDQREASIARDLSKGSVGLPGGAKGGRSGMALG